MAAPDPRFAAIRPHQVMFRLVLLQGLLLLLAFLLSVGCTYGAGSVGGKRPGSAPTITTVVPATPRPGGEVILSGTGLSPSGVRFGGVPALTWRGNGDTDLVVQVPRGALPGPVEVETPLGIADSAPLALLPPPSAPAPTVLFFAPHAGLIGTTVTIQGRHLADTSQVSFGGVAATDIRQVSATQVQAVVPAGALTGPVAVTTPGGSWSTVSPFIVTTPPLPATTSLPVIADFTPSTGGPGQVVTIVGSGFSVPLVVAFGDAPGTAGGTALLSPDTELLSDVQVSLPGVHLPGEGQVITARVPAGLTGPATIYVLCGEGLASTFGPPARVFTPAAPPIPPAIITLPASAAPGTTVAISGNGLGRATGVYFGDVAGTISSASLNTVNAVVPAGAQSGFVTLTFPDQLVTSTTQLAIDGTPAPPAGLPQVAALSIQGDATAPLTGPAGTNIVITGSGLSGAMEVFVNGVAAYHFVVDNNSDTQITAQVPIMAAGSGAVTVATPLGLGHSSGLAQGTFAVTLPTPPHLSTVLTAPGGQAEAAPGQGIEVALTGTGFQQGAVVNFGGFNVPPDDVAFDSDTSMTVTNIPDTAATGTVYLLVEPNGLAIGPQFGILPPTPVPTLTSVSTPSGPAGPAVSGPVGTVVTIHGQNIDGVIGIALQLDPTHVLEVTDWDLAADGSTLTFRVPDDAVAGTQYDVRVAFGLAGFTPILPGTPGTLTLTVTAPAPVITDFSPREGVPGTEVTLVGSGFRGVTQALYGQVPLPDNSFIIDSDTEMRVLIPDEETDSGTIGVANSNTPPTHAQTATIFNLLPSRTGARNLPLVAGVNALSGLATLDFPELNRSRMFGTLGVPNAPVFHPLDPLAALSDPVVGNAVPAFTLSLQLPAPFFATLPPEVSAKLNELDLDPANVSIYVVSQNYFWDGVTPGTGVYLFRPHYWTDPDAPYQGVYSEETRLGAGMFYQAPGITFEGQGDGAFVYGDSLVQGASPTQLGLVTPRDSQFPLAGLIDPAQTLQSTGFWSVVEENGTAAATLHLFFDPDEQANLDQLAQDLGGLGSSLGDLVVQMTPTLFPSLDANGALEMLHNLFLPLVAEATRMPIASGADDEDLLTLTGTSLGQTDTVTMADEDGNGIPVTFRNISDTILTVTVPRGIEGTLIITTPYGQSAEIATP